VVGVLGFWSLLLLMICAFSLVGRWVFLGFAAKKMSWLILECRFNLVNVMGSWLLLLIICAFLLLGFFGIV